MSILLTNIKQLLQVRDDAPTYLSGKEMKNLPILENAWVWLENDTIKDYGTMDALPEIKASETIDCTGRVVMPSWVDSHSHLVFAGTREQEFVDRINGLSYQEIAERGGGILNSAKRVQEATEEELYKQSAKRLEELIQLGTGAIEIKSGYGLTTDAEMKMLRVAKQLGENYPVTIKTTFLGAHAVPATYKDDKAGYMKLIIDEMLPKIEEEGLADYVDIFCEKGFFSVEDTEQLLEAAKEYNLTPKIHVNQFNAIGGIPVAVKHNALSVDHLEVITDEDIEALRGSGTMPVALPTCSFFISIPYANGRKIIDAGLPLAIASDLNPGTTPSGNMNFVMATACIKLRLTPEEAINAATINGAYAMGVLETHGSITKGKKASLIITKEMSSYNYMPYAFGSNLVDKVILNGKFI
ncbi:MAG TPA: imidazolonepropionase [Flavobacteriaceae bacterium]|nr:imidazolonepropionase [Flavobacteriaceae bacterium]